MLNGTQSPQVIVVNWCACGKTALMPLGITEEQLEALLASWGGRRGMTRVHLEGTIGLIGNPVTVYANDRLFVRVKTDYDLWRINGWATDLLAAPIAEIGNKQELAIG